MYVETIAQSREMITGATGWSFCITPFPTIEREVTGDSWV
jgi:hypothetical protein